MTLTEDGFLGGRLTIAQPARGVRSGSDAVLLAAAVPAGPGERALELGTGAGVAALCLAWRVPDLRVVGLENQAGLADLARRNAAANGLAGRVRVVTADLTDLPPGGELAPGSFDHVLANPPFFVAPRQPPSPDPSRAAARAGPAGVLRAWVRAAAGLTRAGGTLTLIQRADRWPELEGLLAGLGRIAILPLAARPGRAVKRVLVRCRLGPAAPIRRLPPLIVHGADGAYRPEIEAVLRGGRALGFGPAGAVGPGL